MDNYSVLSANLGLETRDMGLTRATKGPQEQSQGWQPCVECGLWMGNAWHFAQSHTRRAPEMVLGEPDARRDSSPNLGRGSWCPGPQAGTPRVISQPRPKPSRGIRLSAGKPRPGAGRGLCFRRPPGLRVVGRSGDAQGPTGGRCGTPPPLCLCRALSLWKCAHT